MASVRRLRRDLAVFAEAVGWPLREWQARPFGELAPSTTTCIVAGRGMGKSRTLALVAVHAAFADPRRLVLIVSASELAARRLLATVREVVTGSELLRGSAVEEQAGLLTLVNGSEVRCVSASERQIRGWQADLLLLDEAQFVPPDAMDAARGTTSSREGPIILASSAGVAAGAFYDEAMRGERREPPVRTFRWVAAAVGGEQDAPWITPSLIERERASLGELRFRAEYEAEFASGADSLFSRELLDAVTCDYAADELRAMRGPARVTAGVDWAAVGADRNALVAVGRLATDPTRFAVRCATRWPAGVTGMRSGEEIAASPAHFDAIVGERNGLGAPYCELLWRALRRRAPDEGGGSNPRVVVVTEGMYAPVRRRRVPGRGFATSRIALHVTAESKAATYSALRLLIERRRLLLPAGAEELRRELLMLRVDLTASGSERIEASSGHDDLPDALAMSLIPFRERGGAWRTLIGNLAEGHAPPAELPPGVESLPASESAAGIRVPREPIWQSVRGTELTFPAGFDPDELARDPDADARTRAMREQVADATRRYRDNRKGAADAV